MNTNLYEILDSKNIHDLQINKCELIQNYLKSDKKHIKIINESNHFLRNDHQSYFFAAILSTST
jgi:esterase/lipase